MMKKLVLFIGIVCVSFFSVQKGTCQLKGDKKIITLKAFCEKYVGIEIKDSKVFAKYGNAKLPNTQFKVYDLGNDQIALKTSNDKYLSYNDDNQLVASKLMVGEREKFTVVKVSDEWLALKASNGTFVSFDPKKDNQIIVGKKMVAEWESFFITTIYNPEVKTEEIVLSGSIINEKSKAPIAASIDITNSLSGESITQVKAGADGKFTAKIPSNTKITVNAKLEKYLPISKNIDTEGKKTAQIEIALTPIEVGGVVKLNNILFQLAKATLKAESFAELDNIYQVFMDNPTMEVEISGHTDSDGSDTYNQKLSADRANSVKDYLVQKGIVATRITAVGYGESKPIAPNDTPEGKEMNRRVEFKILKN
jgi:outer membrane protein OmpA-like peptidoglycan-associated protein